MRFIASFADRVIAAIESVNIGFTYKGLIEGRLSSGVDNKVDFRQSGFEKGTSGRPFQR